MKSTKSSILPALERFTALYCGLLGLSLLAVLYLGFNPPKGLRAGFLGVAAVFAVGCFVKLQRRGFSRSEYWGMLLGSMLVDVVVRLYLTYQAFKGRQHDVAIVGAFVLLTVTVTHGVLLALIYSPFFVRGIVAHRIKSTPPMAMPSSTAAPRADRANKGSSRRETL